MPAEIETAEKPAARKAARRAAKAAEKGTAKGAAKGAGKAKAGKAKAKARPMAAEADKAPSAAQKRAQKRKRLTEANTITFVMETEVRRFVSGHAKAAGMDIAPFMQKLVESYVLDNAPEGDALAKRIAAKRAVLDRVVSLAREMAQAGAFDEHFILNVVRNASADADFVAQYEAAVDAQTADERALARAQAPINQQMGRLIKRAAAARSKRDDQGKILRAQVQGEMISSYTLLEKAD